jgi:cell wall-associated NlpC family hydrolase
MSPFEVLQRDAVVAQAELWLRTPYQHRQHLLGVGVDCAWLLIEVYHATGLIPSIDPGAYAQDWHLHRSEERYLGWLELYGRQIDVPQRGDVAVWKFGRTFSHGAVVVDEHRIIHAYRDIGVEFADMREERLSSHTVRYYTLNRYGVSDGGQQ